MADRTTTGVTIPRVSVGQSSTRTISGQSTARGSSATPVLRVVSSQTAPQVIEGVTQVRAITSTNTFGTQGPGGSGQGNFNFDSMIEEVRFLLNTNTRNFDFQYTNGQLIEFVIRTARNDQLVDAIFTYNTDGTLQQIEYRNGRNSTVISDIVGAGMAAFNQLFYDTDGNYESDIWTIAEDTGAELELSFTAGELTVVSDPLNQYSFEAGQITETSPLYVFTAGDLDGPGV